MDSASSSALTPPETRPASNAGEAEVKTETRTETETKTESEAESEAESKAEEKVYVGLIPESKDLYAKYDSHGDRSWTDKYPDDLEEAPENEETQKYAVIIRKKKPKEADSTQSLVIDSIIVQSPYLKQVLAKVFDGYPGIIVNVARLTFDAPFECFVHRWDVFEAAKDDDSYDEKTREHVGLLHTIMRQELGDVIQRRADYFANRAVSFDDVWTLFTPGSTVYGSKYGKPVAVRFESGSFVRTQCGIIYQLRCRVIEWDGQVMGWSDLNQQIPQFTGTVPFSDLACYPLEYHPQPELAKAQLVARGRKWLGLAGYHYRQYNGTGIWHDEERSRRETVKARVVVDGKNWEKNNYDHTVYISNMFAGGDDSDDESEHGWEGDAAAERTLSEDELLKTSPIVRGYTLKNKRWMEFYVDDITDIDFNEQAFQSLVLPADRKELILAFAQSQIKNKDRFDDVISGKGKGIVMLLSGGPGIGKTLTAESVAEEMRVPLYIMSAGDLGSDASEIDDNLSEILKMVANWNAVLLLDECDVFLEERTAHDMERNRIVSIFLRTLEYYEGILFLTTNRVRNMDPAFQSRIHMSLEYPALDAAARRAVWQGFLDRAGGHAVAEDELSALAALDLNGRQIKNVLKTASLLACHRGDDLALRHLRTVLQVDRHSL